MLLLQNVLYCLLYILLVKCAVKNNGLNCLYFYPEEYIEEAQKQGIANKDTVMKKRLDFSVRMKYRNTLQLKNVHGNRS